MVLGAAESDARIGNSSPGIQFFLGATLATALMFFDARGPYLEQIRTQLAAGVYPLQAAINAPFAATRAVSENLARRGTLIRDNEALRKDALVRSAELQRLAAIEAENRRLRALLGSTARIPARTEIGEVLAVDMDPLRHRVVLNRGSRAGAVLGQALIDADGVVGQITRDQVYTSEAILITDPDHALPVEIVRNGLRTIAVGTGDLTRLSLPFLTRNADVKVGDLLITSGLGGSFPAGYPVGKIVTVDRATGDAFMDVSAEPAARLDRLHEVLMVAPLPRPPAPAPAEVPVPAPPVASSATNAPPPRAAPPPSVPAPTPATAPSGEVSE